MTTPRSNRFPTSLLRRAAFAGALVLLAVPAGAAAAREEVVRTERRSVDASSARGVSVHHGSGYARIRGYQGRDVQVTATFRVSANTRANAEKFVNGMALEVAPGPDITVRINTPQWNRRNGDVGFAVDLEILMPERLMLAVNNRFGDTSIAGLRSAVTVQSGSGAVTAEDGEGTYNLTNQFGAITVRRITGDARISNQSGAIDVEAVSGAVTITSRFSDVLVSGAGKLTEIDGASGNIIVRDARGGARVVSRFGQVLLERVGGVVVDAGSGDVRALGVDGPAEIKSQFGRVTLRDATGKVTVNVQSGGADIQLPRTGCEDASIEGRFAPIVVYLGTGGYLVNARASFGTVVSEVPMRTTGTLMGRGGPDSTITGEIGDGRCPLQLITSSGNITIKRGTAPPTAALPAPALAPGAATPGGVRIIAPRDARPERAPRAPRGPEPGSLPSPPSSPTSPTQPTPAPAR